MSRFTPLFLLVLVAVLGALAFQQSRREAVDPVDVSRPLFEGVEFRRVTSIRLENIERSAHYQFTRGPRGAWRISDPIEWPVAEEIMQKLVQIVQRGKAQRVPEQLHESAVASLATPRGFLETAEELEDGTTRRVRVEIGKVDLDGLQIFVRSGGQLMRTLRNVESLLNFNLTDLRSKRLFSFRPGEVVEIERIGGWYDGDEPISLGMRARTFGYAWGIVEPVQAQGDPALFAAWTTYMASLRAERFVSDLPEPDLAEFGLDVPWLTIRLHGAAGAIESLHVTQKDSYLYARRGELPNVYRLDTAAIPFLCEAVEHFYDLAFARVTRRSVESVHLMRPDELLRFSRSGDDGWTVATATPGPGGAPTGDETFSMELAADEGVVADLLNATETAEIKRYFTDLAVEDYFGGASSLRGLWIKPYGERHQGGQFAEEFETREGVTLTPFHRLGSSVVGSVDPEFSAWCERPLETFLDRDLWSLTNTRLRTLDISRGERSRSFLRADEHDWRPRGLDIPARELDPVLDYLIFLRAEAHLPEADRPELSDVVMVRFKDVEGNVSTAEIGVTEDGQVQARVGPLRAVLKHPELHANLLEILE